MKKMFNAFRSAIPVVVIALVTIAAKLFAAAPCHGIIYEPEFPEELRKE